jgi:hypothetical protein
MENHLKGKKHRAKLFEQRVQQSQHNQQERQKEALKKEKKEKSNSGTNSEKMKEVKEEGEGEGTFYLLAEETLLQIFSDLSFRDLVALSLVNRQWNRILADDSIWREVVILKVGKNVASRLKQLADRKKGGQEVQWKQLYIENVVKAFAGPFRRKDIDLQISTVVCNSNSQHRLIYSTHKYKNSWFALGWSQKRSLLGLIFGERPPCKLASSTTKGHEKNGLVSIR